MHEQVNKVKDPVLSSLSTLCSWSVVHDEFYRMVTYIAVTGSYLVIFDQYQN